MHPHSSAHTTIHYRSDIDGLRAVAVLAVIFYHFFPERIGGGFVGVDVFFVISGYLITQVLAERLNTGKLSLGYFYQRRILRIFPALLLVLIASLVAGWFYLLSKEYARLGSSVQWSAFFSQNFSLLKSSGYFAPPADLNPLLHIWSLSVEEQFYLLYPLVLALAWKRRLLAILVLALLSFAWSVHLVYSNPAGAFYLPWARAWELLIGAGIFFGTGVRFASSEDSAQKKHELLSVLGLFGILGGIGFIDRGSRFPGYFALLPVLGAALFLCAKNSFLNRRVLSHPFFVQVGLISYPLYLWHWPLLAFSRTQLGSEPSSLVKFALIVFSGVLATLTYRFVETPIRYGKKTSPVLKSLFLLFLMLVMGGTGFWIAKKDGFPERSVMSDAQKQMQEMHKAEEAIHLMYPDGACSEFSEKFTHTIECTAYGNVGAREKIVVWGDSHAGSWRFVLYSIAEELNLRVIVLKHPGCAPLLGTRRRRWEPNIPRVCEEFGVAEEVVKSIQTIRPSHIFLAGRWSLYATNPPFFLSTNQEPDRDATVESAKAALQTQIPITLKALRAIAPVTVIYEMPQLKLQVDSPAGANIAKTRDLFEPLEALHLTQESVTRELFQAQSLVQGADIKPVDLFDPAVLSCFDGVCHAIINSTVLYLDDNHVSPQGSMLFRKMFLRHLGK